VIKIPYCKITQKEIIPFALNSEIQQFCSPWKFTFLYASEKAAKKELKITGKEQASQTMIRTLN